MDHLSSTDASFLHFETAETPMHVGSLMLFDLPEGYQGDFYENVKTLLNSGNAVFDGRPEPPAKHARLIRSAVAIELGVDAFVVVKSPNASALPYPVTNSMLLLSDMTSPQIATVLSHVSDSPV